MPVPMAPTWIRLCGSRWVVRGVVGGHVDVADCWDRIAYVGALTCGLVLTNQHTINLLEVPLIGGMRLTAEMPSFACTCVAEI